MDIFGIGPLEFLLILIIMLIILGPNDMVKAGRTIGSFLRKLILSDEWRIVQQAGKEFRNLPDRLVREAGIEDIKKDLPTMEEIRKDLPTVEEITTQSGIPELEKEIQKDFGRTLDQAKGPATVDATQPPSAPTILPVPATIPQSVEAQPVATSGEPAAPAKSDEALMQKPTPPVPEPAASTPEPEDEPDEDLAVSPWANSPLARTPAELQSVTKQESTQSPNSNANPTQS